MNLQSIGGLLFFLGVGSMVLYFMDMEFWLLMWIENWGPTVAWVIRGALAVVGGAMWVIGKQQQPAAEAAKT